MNLQFNLEEKTNFEKIKSNQKDGGEDDTTLFVIIRLKNNKSM